VNESLLSRGVPITLSCLLHLGLGLVLGQQWPSVAVAVRPPVLPVELVRIDPPEEPRREAPEPPAPTPRRPPRPPRLIEPPHPLEAPAVAAEPPLPMPPTPAPAPALPAPIDHPHPAPTAETAAAPGPLLTSSTPPATPAAPSPAPTVPITTAAKPPPAPPEGLTHYARPQGGYQVRPSYPAVARRLGVQGTTLLRVHVLADGRIGEVLVERSAGHHSLDEAAADAVRRWRFDPARRGTEAVAMWVLLPVEFRLR
jgi:protein TonB